MTSFLTGITEPLEFMFLFVAPWLYVIHAFLDGVSFAIADILQVRIGNTFSGGFIDFTLFGILQGNEKTHWIYAVLVGVAWFALYYVLFRFLIIKFNVETPGRESDDEDVRIETKGTMAECAVAVLEVQGGFKLSLVLRQICSKEKSTIF